MGNKLQKSIILTGPSASGKTTLHCCLTLHFGLIPRPVHTTRSLRSGEVQGVDIHQLSEKAYFDNFEKGLYVEESPEASFFGGAYYGTPVKWISETESGKFNCFVCPTVKVARLVKNKLKGNIFWIHLTASEHICRQRILKRNPEMEKENVLVRLKRGSQKIDITGHDYCIDTSHLGAWQIFERVIRSINSDDIISDHEYLCAVS
jgi:guanylate kinase